MMNATRALLMGMILIVISACASKPVLSVEVYQSPTPAQAAAESLTATPYVEFSSLSIVPTNTPIPEVLPSPTSPVAAVMPPDFSPILYGKKYDANTFFLLLGGVQGGAWLTPEQAAAQFSGDWAYDVYTLAKERFAVRGHSPEFSHPSDAYFLGTDVTFDEVGMVGVLQGWPVQQGNVQELASNNQVYSQMVMDWLRAEGVSAPVIGSLHIFRVDLEADGVDEIFIAATSLGEAQPRANAGDYSIVLMRKVVGNNVTTVPLIADLYRSQQEVIHPSTYLIGNFIDLNRDGKLEVVLEIQGWEKFGALVYQVDGATVTQVLK